MIDEKDITKAVEILRKYKEGKSRLEAKIIANEQFWKLRQWNYYKSESDEAKPATAWLWKMIQSRYSDVMDSFPTCNFRPRQSDDVEEAKKLSDIIPVILEQNKYEETYSDIAWYMLKQGGCCQGVFWDGSKSNGLGDISIRKIDLLNIFWEPGVTNIQDSENVFTTELVSNRILTQRYPQTEGHLGGSAVTVSKYLYDDTVDTSEKSVVVDWYYKTEYNGRKAVHYVKFVGDVILYATENETERSTVVLPSGEAVPMGESMAERGLYDHTLYPFVFQDLYPIEGSICGYGLTDIGRDTQMQIDVLNKAMTDNAVVGSAPRFFVKGDGSINEAEFLNYEKPFVHVQGNIDETNIKPIGFNSLPGIYFNIAQAKVDELKFITSNQDVLNGSTPSGVTAGSAISALQEVAGKDARSTNKAFYRAYKEVCYMIVELLRQFYDTPRCFRIVPDTMGEQFVQFSNERLKPQETSINGVQTGYRVPEFDIEVSAEKSSPYKKMEQNELALNFYQQGFFNPQMADQAIQCLEMMDFSHKDDIIQKIRENGTILQKMLEYQQIALQLAQQIDPVMADQLAQQIMADSGQPIVGGKADISLGNEGQSLNEKARTVARESTEA